MGNFGVSGSKYQSMKITDIFFCVLIISLSIFALYAIFKYDDQLYVRSTHLIPDRSEHLKELIGLSQFPNLYIEKYIHKVVEGEAIDKICFTKGRWLRIPISFQ